ncbi:MAG: glutamate--tRNA ligase [Pseudomonadota bacterium]
MSSVTITRFAPSPTGELHLGNARTALFNALLARRGKGAFLLRIEDTDAARSLTQHTLQLQEDLRWMGLEWDAEPLHQSQRGDIYNALLAKLEGLGAAYPCFCGARELELARAARVASSLPPRYSGRCRNLSIDERNARVARGESASLRFAVPESGAVEFTDMVHGPRHFNCADIGDFVLRRADGSASFFFTNAVDDALSGVTQVLRGDDHLANTPRQLLILRALQLPAPQYGHLALITGDDGAPLSKRNGAVGLRALREQGILPEAIANHLYRLGHSTAAEGLLSLEQMAGLFDTSHLQRSPAHFQMSQLLGWQREAVHKLDTPRAAQWLGTRLPADLTPAQRDNFITALLQNVVQPDDVLPWVQVVFGMQPAMDEEAAVVVAAADKNLFAAAAAAAEGNDFAAISAAAKAATGLRGPALFKPLRAALTGRLAGPELGPLLRAMPQGTARQRLARFA